MKIDPISNSWSITSRRRGAVLPLFALLLPVLLILCGLAVNGAYVQLVATEMKIATDAAAHAGGRAMSIQQSTEAAYDMVEANAALNTVAGRPLGVIMTEDWVQFGKSIRGNNGYGRYEFTHVPRALVDNGTEQATSISVTSSMNIQMMFNAIPGFASIPASRESIATQVDRDIALVLDRSGSMLSYKDEDELSDALYDLYNSYEQVWVPGYWYWHRRRGWQWRDGYHENRRKISWDEYRWATDGIYNRYFTANVIQQLATIDTDMSEFAWDHENTSSANRHSRWYYLNQGVDAFLDVLEYTDQEEHVSLVTFASSARLEYSLEKTYGQIRSKVDSLYPTGATAIGSGMQTGLPPIISGENARAFAAKTIVVLTDGISNNGPDPVTTVENIVANQNVTVHTVTFTRGADENTMQEVAEVGGGRHYHADEGEELIEIFEEIANNLPTILTE